MSRGVLPTIFRQDKTTEGISLELRWDPKGPLDLPGFEEVLLAIHIGPAAKLTCRRGVRYYGGEGSTNAQMTNERPTTHRRRPTPMRFLVVLLALTGPQASWADSRPRVFHAVDVQIPSPPIPVNVAGKRHLAYELHITNFRPTEVTLTRIEVLAADSGNRLGDFSGAELNDRLGRPGVPREVANKRVIGAGMRAVFYVWVALDDDAATPSMLRHKIEIDIIRESNREHAIVDAGALAVRNERPVVLNRPLRGGPWVAIYDPMLIGGHRTAIYAVDGRARIPARFAIG